MRVRRNISWLLCLGVAAACVVVASVTPPPLVHGASPASPPVGKAVATSRETLAVKYNAGRLDVRAEQVPLCRILQEVARQTSIEVSGVSSLEQDVSVQFAGLPLLDGFRRLLRPINYLLRLERSPQGALQRIQIQVLGHGAIPSSAPLPGEASPPLWPRVRSEALRQAMVDADPGVRQWATERLGERGDMQAVPHLLAALDDAHPDVRRGALASLPQYGEIALEPLQHLLRREQNYAVRIVALQTLVQVPGGTEQTVALLNELLGDQDARIRAAVVAALAHTNDTRATEALHMAADDGAPDVRVAALQALARRVNDDAAEATVARHLDDTDAAVRDVATVLLETFPK